MISQVRGGITRTLVYDGQDHLMRWNSSVNSQEEWYLYDASGQRVLRRSSDGTNTTMTVYAFGLEEHQYSYAGSGSSATNTSNTYYYSLGGRILGTWDGTSATTTFLLSDTLGSVVSSFNNLPNGAATVLGNQLYGPYGNQRVQQGTIGTSKGFTGHYNDWLTGLDYYNARYYDPVIGQFLSADTVEGNAQGMDPYSYVGGNPETMSDPTGHFREGPDGQHIWTGSNGKTYENTPTQEAHQIGYSAATVSYYQSQQNLSAVHHVSHPRYNLSSTQGRKDCNHDAGCRGAMQKASFDHIKDVASQVIGWGIIAFDIGSTLLDNLNGPSEAEQEEEQLLEEDQMLLEEEKGVLSEWSCSFTSKTLVNTDTGEKPIGTLKQGQQVLAYNPKTHQMEWQPILHVWVNHDNDLVDLTLTTDKMIHDKGKPHTVKQSEVIHTNKKHPFLTTDDGFMPVGQLKLGMHIMQANGQVGVVTGWKLVSGMQTMYNLEVAQDHTFTVGNEQWIVHNSCLPDHVLENHVDITDEGLHLRTGTLKGGLPPTRFTSQGQAESLVNDMINNSRPGDWERQRDGRFLLRWKFDAPTGELMTSLKNKVPVYAVRVVMTGRGTGNIVTAYPEGW